MLRLPASWYPCLMTRPMQIVRFAALAVVLLGAMAQVQAPARDAIWRTDGLDHVMLSTDNIDRTTASRSS
jgi:hypothetical protein